MRSVTARLLVAGALACLSSVGVATAPSGVAVTTDRPVYRYGETVTVIVHNDRAVELSYEEGPGCGITFEHEVGSSWQGIRISSYEDSRAPCERVTVPARGTRLVRRPIDRRPPTGRYRVVFRTGRDLMYSAAFQIEA